MKTRKLSKEKGQSFNKLFNSKKIVSQTAVGKSKLAPPSFPANLLTVHSFTDLKCIPEPEPTIVHLPTPHIHLSTVDRIVLPKIRPNIEFDPKKEFHEHVNLSEAFSIMQHIQEIDALTEDLNEALKDNMAKQRPSFWQRVRKFFSQKDTQR